MCSGVIARGCPCMHIFPHNKYMIGKRKKVFKHSKLIDILREKRERNIDMIDD